MSMVKSAFKSVIITSKAKRVVNNVVYTGIFNRKSSVDSPVTEMCSENRKSYDDIPGPTVYPVIKIMHKFLPLGSLCDLNGLELLQQIRKEYGDIVRLNGMMGRNNAIFLFRPDYIEKVYRTESQYPERIGFESLKTFRNLQKDYYGSCLGLLVSDGKEWHDFRSKINAPMLQPKIIRLYTTVLSQIAEEVVERLKSLRDKDSKIKSDFGHEMNLWSLESIGAVALGTRIGCFRGDLGNSSMQNKLIKAVKDIFNLSFEVEFKTNLMKVLLPNSNYQNLMNAYQDQMDVAQFYINQVLSQNKSQKEEDGPDEMAILNKLAAIDKKVAVVMANDMLLAGVDTTANAAIALLYFLALNQEKQNKLRRHLKEALAKGTDADRIPYLKACVKESMRMFPITSGNMRTLTQDITLGEYNIPKKTDVIFAHQLLAIDSDQFANPTDFRPERWLRDDSEGKLGCPHAFSHLPFGFGVRACPGRRIAELEMQLFLARFISAFRVEWDGPPITSKTATLNYFVGPFHFVLHDA